MLELSHPELELVEVVPRHEVELVGDPAECREGALREARAASAHAARQLENQLLEHVEEQPAATALCHAASCAAAGAAFRAAPAPTAPQGLRSRRRRAPAPARRRAP